MTKIVTFFAILTTSSLIANAAPNYAAISKKLYPDSPADQVFTAKFFGILEAHKTQDPLLEGPGPSIQEYSLDKISFAFITNIKDTAADLVFFNWKLPVFEGLEPYPELSDLYGANVYIMKNVKGKSIASQGQDRSQLTNFSYMLGARTTEMQIRKDAPAGYQIPEQYLDWKPNPEYMDRSAPLRKALDINTLTMLSPSRELFMNRIPSAGQAHAESLLVSHGGFENVIMGMMIHEMFHVKEGQDLVNGLAKRRSINENRKEIVKQLQADARLRSLVATYVKIVFSIGDSLKNKTVSAKELELLADLSALVAELKNNYSETWKFIWNYEYTEGFAEYVSAYSMIQGGIVTLEQKIDLEKADMANNFAYRSGAIGGLYLANRIKQMPFGNQEDNQESLWQIVVRKAQVQPSKASADDLVAKYSSIAIDGEDEVKRVIDYLVSTVMEVK